jgi:superoxide dismutase, Fe-Mn family
MGLLASQPVPLPYHELPGVISARALSEHYKLYTGYRDMLQRVDQGLLDALHPKKTQLDSPYSGLLWSQNFALSGAYLHELYFGNLGLPTIHTMLLRAIDKAIENRWGTADVFWSELHAAGLQARGWIVLAVANNDPNDLRLFALDAHDLGPVYGYTPLLVIDCYEHAYWMDFGTEKGAYLTNIAKYIQWGEVNRRYEEAPAVSTQSTVYSYDRRASLKLGPGTVNEGNTKALQKSKLTAKNHGDFGSAILSAGFYAKKTGKTMFVYSGNSFGHGVWRVSEKSSEYLNAINNTGAQVISVTPELVVSYHAVR